MLSRYSFLFFWLFSVNFKAGRITSDHKMIALPSKNVYCGREKNESNFLLQNKKINFLISKNLCDAISSSRRNNLLCLKYIK